MLSSCGVGEDPWVLIVPWAARRSNQSILKEINPEYSLEGWMLKLKLQYFGHLMRRVGPLEKTLMLPKTEGRRRRGRQRMWWLDGIIDSVDMSLSKPRKQWRTGKPGVLQNPSPCVLGSQRVWFDWTTPSLTHDVHTYIYTYMCIYIHIYTNIHIYIHTYIHIYTHTHTYIYNYKSP